MRARQNDLFGGADPDTIRGGPNNDLLQGGAGLDTLIDGDPANGNRCYQDERVGAGVLC